jgi:hypothetical protein
MIIPDYIKFTKLRGRPLTEINPESDEVALNIEETLEAIEILKNNQLPVLGGDILSTDSDKLIYAYQCWGSEYHYLNWYCDKLENEGKEDYLVRSYKVARQAIEKAIEISKKLKKDCFFVLVV